ncbi:hypothetical protein SAMN06269185_3221 [Natronoarchaeum philippinense]|uniref:CopG family transcriptional regulator n=1 Tax=Natronoarchaeum philippinense TaxID=558529 RepID=A0A285P9Y5_NATPI|nr:hypothetical protein [Natronoarchaeum philippinense]SNZ18057.1 hypothetical protein SAMN06269185_3221 [Natronoarchaeum philippinense]
MASDKSGSEEVSVALPADVRDWLGDRTSNGETPDDVARRLLAAHYELANGEGPDPDELAPRDDAVDERVDQLDAEFRDLLDDVRKRVIQLKRETDQKADRDHDHPEVADRVDDLEQRTAEAADRLAELDDAVAAAEDKLATGFDNYEDILEYLTDETGALRERTDTLARAVIELRSEFERIAADRVRRERVRELKHAAAQYGVRTAECDACEASVDVAMLTAPECPHCATRFTDVRPGSRFLKPNVLETGDPPALAGSDDQSDDLNVDLDSIVEEDRDVPDGIEWATTDGGERASDGDELSSSDARQETERTDGGEP